MWHLFLALSLSLFYYFPRYCLFSGQSFGERPATARWINHQRSSSFPFEDGNLFCWNEGTSNRWTAKGNKTKHATGNVENRHRKFHSMLVSRLFLNSFFPHVFFRLTYLSVPRTEEHCELKGTTERTVYLRNCFESMLREFIVVDSNPVSDSMSRQILKLTYSGEHLFESRQIVKLTFSGKHLF